MSKFVINKSKNKNLSKEELLQLSKEELVDRIIKLEAHNFQLKNILLKSNEDKSEIATGGKSKKQRAFDFSKCITRRIFLRLAYLGGKYHGLAAQEDSIYTIEHFLFAALTKSLLIPSRDKANYHRCGRTDKGVSGSGQVISLLIRSKLTEEEINNHQNISKELPYCKMLNKLLPNDIRVICWMPVRNKENGEIMSARFDCKYRTYKYWFPKCLMNIAAMTEACKYLEGSHDFRNLCKMDVGNGVTEFIRHIYSADIISASSELNATEYSMYYLKIVGNAFLWHQIRCIAAVLFLIGNGKEDPLLVKNLLNIDLFPRKPQYNMAIEFPLNLFQCSYDEYQNNVINQDSEIQLKIEDSSNEFFFKNNWYIENESLIHVLKTFHDQWMTTSIQASMIKDIIDDLLSYYEDNNAKISRSKIMEEMFRSNFLLQGVCPKNYIPLSKRPTCETLENRIDHFVKRKRITESTANNEPPEDVEMENIL